MVIGIGLNVNSTMRTAPKTIRRKATSLRNLTGRKWDDARLLTSILSHLFDGIRQFSREGFAPFLDDWYRLDAVPLGSRISVEQSGHIEHGSYAGINPSGALRIMDAAGRIRTAISGTLILA